MSGELSVQLRALRRAAARRRHLLAAGLAAAAVACGLTAVQPAAADTVPVLVAAHDLAAGATLQRADLRTAAFAAGTEPAGALRTTDAAVGHVLVGGVRAGEPLTDVRFVGRPLLEALDAAGLVATPVRIADAGSARLLQPGDLVDVLAATPPGAGTPSAPSDLAGTVADGVRVLAVPTAEDDGAEGALVLLATSRTTAARLALASVTSRLSVTLRGT